MSLQHLHYAMQEIDTVSQLLTLKNATFFKRALARLIAMRTDDFIKLAFAANKQTLKLKIIKDELNALEGLYKDHFKLQRDKYGAHFQHLDFGSRLQNWSEINASKASFFTDMPREIYSHFSTDPIFIPYTPTALDEEVTKIIEKVNDAYDLEAHPNLSTDILALTRPNSGGVLNFSMIHTKAGVLKSLELLIEYELAQLNSVKDNPNARRLFVKLFITDLLSYVDNYFTRTDIPNTAPQYEEGFDFYVAENISDGTEEAHKIIEDFKAHFALTQHVQQLRGLRNTACGHIDAGLSITQLEATIDSIDLVKFKNFYFRLKAILRSVCHSTIYLTQYLIDPFEPLHGVESMVALEVSSFDGQPFPQAPRRYKSPNDVEEYERNFDAWLRSRDDAARSYFWNSFIDSDIQEQIQISMDSPGGGQSYRYHKYRKAHGFFETKLTNAIVSIDEKISIVDLFLHCRSGDPETLAFILDRTYPADGSLQVHYIYAMGKLSGKRTDVTLNRCNQIFTNGNLQAKCLATKAVFGIDLTARRSSTGKHDSNVSTYSTYLKGIFNSRLSSFNKLALSLALVSDYVFGGHHLSDSLDEFYKAFFESEFIAASNQLLHPFLKIGDNAERLSQIQSMLSTNRYSTLVGTLSDFIEEKGLGKEAMVLRTLVTQQYIECARNDNQELHNLSVIYFKTGDLENAISIAKFLTEKNAHIADYNYLLLDLYRHNSKYRTEFEALKNGVLQSFNLSDEERADFEAIAME